MLLVSQRHDNLRCSTNTLRRATLVQHFVCCSNNDIRAEKTVMTLGSVTYTRTFETEERYRKVYRTLQRKVFEEEIKAGRNAGEFIDVDQADVVDYFLRKRAIWSSASERQYKAGLMLVLREAHLTGRHDAWHLINKLEIETNPKAADTTAYFKGEEASRKGRERIEREIALIKAERRKGKDVRRSKRVRGNTSEQKAKAIFAKDIVAVLTRLELSRSKWAQDTRQWFQAGLITGLRPIEWSRATIEKDENERQVLRVVNAKNSNNRTFAEARHLVLDRLSVEQFGIVAEFAERAAEKALSGHFESWFHACRLVLLRVATELFPHRVTHPSLYTTRHMFAANAKAKLTKAEVAALMGHGSLKTAGAHYARRSAAIGGVGVDPSVEDLRALALRTDGAGPEVRVREGRT